MKSTSPLIALLAGMCVCSLTWAAPKPEPRKPANSKQQIEALLVEQARLQQLVEIQSRQLQEMSNRFNATRLSEPSPNVPYTYP